MWCPSLFCSTKCAMFSRAGRAGPARQFPAPARPDERRLLAGGFRDPLVGRDVLAGCLLGAFSTALDRLAWLVPAWLGFPPVQPQSGPQLQLLGARTMLADLTQILIAGPYFWLSFLFVLVLLRGLLRKEWAAAVGLVLMGAVVSAAGRPPNPAGLVPVTIFLVCLSFY